MHPKFSEFTSLAQQLVMEGGAAGNGACGGSSLWSGSGIRSCAKIVADLLENDADCCDCSAHVLLDRYKENRLKKHLESKKITDLLALDLLSKLLELDPKKRITAMDAALVSFTQNTASILASLGSLCSMLLVRDPSGIPW